MSGRLQLFGESVGDLIQLVSVRDLINSLTESIDFPGGFDLPRIILAKSWDGDFGALVNRIEREGFIVPICVAVNEYENKLIMGNGHHRLVAAILLCLDEIPVAFSFDTAEYMLSKHTSPQDKYLTEITEDECDYQRFIYGCIKGSDVCARAA